VTGLVIYWSREGAEKIGPSAPSPPIISYEHDIHAYCPSTLPPPLSLLCPIHGVLKSKAIRVFVANHLSASSASSRELHIVTRMLLSEVGDLVDHEADHPNQRHSDKDEDDEESQLDRISVIGWVWTRARAWIFSARGTGIALVAVAVRLFVDRIIGAMSMRVTETMLCHRTFLREHDEQEKDQEISLTVGQP
jgi:hypothetical protein